MTESDDAPSQCDGNCTMANSVLSRVCDACANKHKWRQAVISVACEDCGRACGTEEQMEDADFESTVPELCFSSVLFDGDTDSDCRRITHIRQTSEARDVLARLVAMVEAALPAINNAIFMETNRGRPYTGPKILLEEAKAFLARKR